MTGDLAERRVSIYPEDIAAAVKFFCTEAPKSTGNILNAVPAMPRPSRAEPGRATVRPVSAGWARRLRAVSGHGRLPNRATGGGHVTDTVRFAPWGRWPMVLARILGLGLGSLLLLQAGAASAQDQPPIGQATVVVRNVMGEIAAKPAPLRVGDALLFREVIAAGEHSAAQARFIDATVLSVGSNSRVTLDEFIVPGAGRKPSMTVTLAQGVLRLATGTMASEAYGTRTTTAAVGVRGTVFNLLTQADGATVIYVEDGVATFSNLSGASVDVAAGLASRIDAQSGPPSPPQPPSAAVQAAVAAMVTKLALEAPPAEVLPAVAIDGVAALTAAAAALAAQTSQESPGGGLK